MVERARFDCAPRIPNSLAGDRWLDSFAKRNGHAADELCMCCKTKWSGGWPRITKRNGSSGLDGGPSLRNEMVERHGFDWAPRIPNSLAGDGWLTLLGKRNGHAADELCGSGGWPRITKRNGSSGLDGGPSLRNEMVERHGFDCAPRIPNSLVGEGRLTLLRNEMIMRLTNSAGPDAGAVLRSEMGRAGSNSIPSLRNETVEEHGFDWRRESQTVLQGTAG